MRKCFIMVAIIPHPVNLLHSCGFERICCFVYYRTSFISINSMVMFAHSITFTSQQKELVRKINYFKNHHRKKIFYCSVSIADKSCIYALSALFQCLSKLSYLSSLCQNFWNYLLNSRNPLSCTL